MAPRLLVTGFTPFPGAAVNPTEALVAALPRALSRAGVACDLATAILPVDWRALPARLEALGRSHRPDLAVHFGLDADASGFRLERRALNRVAPLRPDNRGHCPTSDRLGAGPDEVASGLPLAAIAAALQEAGLPVEWSDDAGAYLCNAAFWFACSGTLAAYRPRRAGFIHVPPAGAFMTEDELLAGAVRLLTEALAA